MTQIETPLQLDTNRYYQGLESHEASLVRFTISVLEDILVNLQSSSDRDYVQGRIGYYEERCLGTNHQKSGPLSLAEIAELQAIMSDYYAAFETNLQSANDLILQCHLAMVKTARDSLEAMIHG